MCHVLIIEDEPLIAMHLQDMLQEIGATSFTFAESQQDAVTSAASRRPDLITSDVKLTQGTGPAAVGAIHRALGGIPVIFITGTPEECHPCEPPGIVLRKPVRQADLGTAFHTLMPAVV